MSQQKKRANLAAKVIQVNEEVERKKKPDRKSLSRARLFDRRRQKDRKIAQKSANF